MGRCSSSCCIPVELHWGCPGSHLLCFGILGVREGLSPRRGCWDGEGILRVRPRGTHPA